MLQVDIAWDQSAMPCDKNQFQVKLAETSAEVLAAQKLRYRVFVEEMGAVPGAEPAEADEFDAYYDHLILIDRTLGQNTNNVVGVSRLMHSAAAARNIGYYGAVEFDLSVIVNSRRPALELGRTCVDKKYRGGLAMHFLWNGLAEYVLAQNIEIIFGTASFPGKDIAPIAQALSYLHHNHLAPEDLLVRANSAQAVDCAIMSPDDIDNQQAYAQIPALIKAYIRLGGFIGKGAVIDKDFNTIDVCLLLDTARMSPRHRAFYTRSVAA